MRRNVLDKGLANGSINAIGPALGMAIAGGAAGLFGGGGGDSTSSTEMPAWLKEYYTEKGGALDTAQGLFEEGGPDYYGGDMVADLNQMQTGGINDIANIAANDTLNPAGGNYAESVLAGDYLGGDQFMSAYGDEILDGVNSNFARAGRGGSGYHAQAATKELGNTASRLYDSERGRQNQILSNIPSLTDSAYTGAQNVVRAGDVLQNQEQREIGADVNEFNFNENRDINNLQTYMDFLGQVPAGNTTTTSGPSTNPLIAGIGGAMSGASLGSNWGN